MRDQGRRVPSWLDDGSTAVSPRLPSRSGAVRRAILQFTAAGLAAAVVVAVVALYLARAAATQEAIHDARTTVETIGEWLVEPALDDAVMAGEPDAVAQLERTLATRLDRAGVVRVKLWAPDGRILYSDEPALVGTKYRLDAHELEVLRSGGTAAEVSDLSEPENRFERDHSKLLEVYHGITAPSGAPALLEAYLPYEEVTRLSRRVWLSFLPAVVGGLLLLCLIQLPLAARLARRVADGERYNALLARRAADASEAERRRIAADLHDGVVQGLAGASYSLAAAADRSARAGLHDVAATLRATGMDLRRWVRELRTLLVSIAPPKLHDAGLEPALSDLAAGIANRDVAVSLHVDDELDLDVDTEALLFRAAQEALRNAVTHASASHIAVVVQRDDGHVRLEVADDGAGFAPERREAALAEGHLGLALVAALASDAGGTLAVESSPGAGTRLRLEVPEG